jgi:sirohydrochlorin cobaltochelatase
MKNGLILFAHGARDPRWAAPFESVAAEVRQLKPQTCVQLAYLEFMQPNLTEAAAQLAGQGCTQIDVLPMFLGSGGHVRQDLPKLLAQIQQAFPTVPVRLHPAIGEVGSVTTAMARAAVELSGDRE